MKNFYHYKFRLTALAAIFALLTGIISPTCTFADDAPPTQQDASTTSVLSADATVQTSDAVSQSDSRNDVNTNITSTNGSALTDSGAFLVTADNTTSTEDTTSSTASTGDNAASNNSGNTSISTGDAFASANSIDVINTNIIDSNGLLAFSNFFSGLGIDLRGLDLSYFNTPSAGTGTTDCSLQSCSDSTVTITTRNTATATNTVSVIASTGNDTASSANGDATISTGNAYASGNAVNVINTNIVKSNYLLVGINNFGDLLGDITLPGASFFKQLLSGGSNASHVHVTTDNDATVTDSTSATADTGDNSATSENGDSSLTTGNALSSATTLNQVNTNQVGGTSTFFLFRIWGAFTGAIQGLPAGMTWQQTPNGLVIENSSDLPTDLDQSVSRDSINASTTNDASLTNNVSVYALTGDNEARTSAGTATISTGNAYAAANSINIVNTNLIGTNWIYAIFNIFGNLSGNIAFGHPDLWLGAVAETGNPTPPGSSVTFHFTVANRGDADATNVKLTADFLKQMLDFDTGTSTDTGESWNLGTIPAGQSEEFTYTALAGSVSNGDSVAVPVSATVVSDETDNNPVDNTDTITIVVSDPIISTGGGGSGTGESFASDPKLSITKTADTVATSAPASVGYTIDVFNNGGPAYHAVATDILTDSTGSVLNTQSWDLDTINYQDEIKVTYSVVFDKDTKPGDYTNTVVVTGQMHYSMGSSAVPFPAVAASSTLSILPPASESNSGIPECKPYLTSYLKPGAENDVDQVRKLQAFLRGDESEQGIHTTGVYDAATIAAVKRFQKKYASDILTPWGYNKPTGIVYYTTQQKINNLWCVGRRSFDLTQNQLSEIGSTRKIIETIIPKTTSTATGTSTTPAEEMTLPPGIEVGVAPAGDTTNVASAQQHSWFSKLRNAQQSIMANVLSAFKSIAKVMAPRETQAKEK